jgi:adenine-specific DNA-methyltransferase
MVISEIKRNGIFYTPKSLANILVRPLINSKNKNIFDPAYGAGSLLLAFEEESSRLGKSRRPCLWGCDKKPKNGFLSHLSPKHFFKVDFFEFSTENKFDTIVLNPPYVRHHFLSERKVSKYQSMTRQYCELSTKSDLWAYFLLKSTRHLKIDGAIGAILPWSFFQADYAQSLRVWLANHFSKIRVLVQGEDLFLKTGERVLLLWLHGFGRPSKKIEVSFSKRLGEKPLYSTLDNSEWVQRKVLFGTTKIKEILSKYELEYGFSKFIDHADVKIGIVTGADNFFIVPKNHAVEKKIPKKNLLAIFTSSKELGGLILNGNSPKKYLLKLDERGSSDFRSLIKEGVKKGYHQRAHSLRRKPWYSVILGGTPDAFFPYRSFQTPYLVLNNYDVQCTNSIHRIFFKKLTVTEIKWIQISLLSVPSQLSIEANSKTYGSGVLKIEPYSLKEAIVFRSNDRRIGAVYRKISTLLHDNKKQEAIDVATEFINNALGVSKQLDSQARSALESIQNRRLSQTNNL